MGVGRNIYKAWVCRQAHLMAAVTRKFPLLGLRLSQSLPQSHVRTIAQALVRNLPIVREFAHGEVEQVNITAAAQTKESQMHLHCDSAGHTHAAKMACLLPDTNARIRQRARHPDAARRLSTGGIGLA